MGVPQPVLSKLQVHEGLRTTYIIELKFVQKDAELDVPTIHLERDEHQNLTVRVRLTKRSSLDLMPVRLTDEDSIETMHYDVRREMMLHYPDWWLDKLFEHVVTERLIDAESMLRAARRKVSRKGR